MDIKLIYIIILAPVVLFLIVMGVLSYSKAKNKPLKEMKGVIIGITILVLLSSAIGTIIALKLTDKIENMIESETTPETDTNKIIVIDGTTYELVPKE